MSWPQAQEYNEAIQNPRVCFQDPDLKQGTVKTNAMGIPVAISGGFASVYQLTTPSGKWAVRCFIREVADSHRRYAEISRALNSHRLTYTAPFEFQQSGIRVGSTAYPIVKMQWMTGELLGEYIERNVSDSGALLQLAEKWVALIADLHGRNMAHGDLQHGNVIVVNDSPKLIDYDGMFVPRLRGLKSNELGHPNYQNPNRTEYDYDVHLDSFSGLVIFTAIRALARFPDLFSYANSLGRDPSECILFSRDDFKHPKRSSMIQEIKRRGDSLLTYLTGQIEVYSEKRISAVPPLAAILSGYSSYVPSPVGATPGATSSDWWKPDNAKHIAEPSAEPTETKQRTPQKSWALPLTLILGGIVLVTLITSNTQQPPTSALPVTPAPTSPRPTLPVPSAVPAVQPGTTPPVLPKIRIDWKTRLADLERVAVSYDLDVTAFPEYARLRELGAATADGLFDTDHAEQFRILENTLRNKLAAAK